MKHLKVVVCRVMYRSNSELRFCLNVVSPCSRGLLPIKSDKSRMIKIKNRNIVFQKHSKPLVRIFFLICLMTMRKDFILKDTWGHFPELRSGSQRNMGASATPGTESQDAQKMLKSTGDSALLPKHAYWFDFWAFVVFDIILFFFIYFVVP